MTSYKCMLKSNFILHNCFPFHNNNFIYILLKRKIVAKYHLNSLCQMTLIYFSFIFFNKKKFRKIFLAIDKKKNKPKLHYFFLTSHPNKKPLKYIHIYSGSSAAFYHKSYHKLLGSLNFLIIFYMPWELLYIFFFFKKSTNLLKMIKKLLTL